MSNSDEWQKYLQEQREKSVGSRSDAAPTSPSSSVPSIDHSRFKIKKLADIIAANSGVAGENAAKTGSRNPSAANASENADESENSGVTSPFISVSDVWEAAERSSHTRKTTRESQPLQQKKLAGIERIASTQFFNGSAQGFAQRPRPNQEQTREQILERLVNPTITLEEAAKIMGVCKATVRRYTDRGVLPHYRTPGNQRRFKLNDIMMFLENQRK